MRFPILDTFRTKRASSMLISGVTDMEVNSNHIFHSRFYKIWMQ